MSNVECPICMDSVGCTDCCTTACGHTFHSTCLFKNFSSSFACPMCRSELIEESEDEGSDDDDEDEGDNEDSDGDDDEEVTGRFTTKQIYEVLKKRGFTTDDLLAFVFESTSRDLVTITSAMEQRSDELFELLNNIAENIVSVDYRDSRTYLQVLAGAKKTDEAGAGPQPESRKTTIIRV